MIAGALELQLFANMARLAKDMNDAKTLVGSSMKTIEGAVSAAKTALGGLGVGIGLGGLIAIAKASIDAAEHLYDLSKATNIAVEDLAGLKLLARQSGTDMDGLAKGINKMSVAIGKSPAEFKALGVTAKDGVGQFKQLADMFNLLEDTNLRNALAQKVFSKSWAELAPALSEGSRGIQAAIDKGKQLSGMTTQMAKEADEFKDKMAEVNMVLGSGMTKAIGPLLPAFHDIALAMKEAAQEGGLLLAVWVGMGGAIQTLAMEVRKFIGLPMTEVAALKQDAEGIQKALAAMSSSVNPGVRARYEEQLGVINARLALLKREEELAKAKPPAVKPEVDKAAAAAAAARAKAFLAEGKDGDSFYRNTLKSLKEKLLLDTELTEVAKLQLAIDALTAKQRAELSPKEEAHLKQVAAEVELLKKRKEAREQEGKNEEALQKMREEGAAASAEMEQKKGEALIAGYEQARQMEFEITLISKTTQEREVAIKMRELENSTMDKTSIGYEKLREKWKAAIISKDEAEQAKERAVSMWKSFEDAGHQAFLSLFDTSKSVLERIRDMLKTHLIELLYQLTVKPFIIQIATSVSGAGVAQAAFGSGGGGGLSSLFSAGSGVSNLFSGEGIMGGIGKALGIGGASSGAVVGASSLTGEAILGGAITGTEAAALGIQAGAGAAGALGAVGAAIPYVGLALAAASMLGLFGEGGGPKPSSIGLTGTPGRNIGFSQNNVTDSEWGQQYAALFESEFAKLGAKGQEFLFSKIGSMWEAQGPDSAQNLVSQNLLPLLKEAQELDKATRTAEEKAAEEAAKEQERAAKAAADAAEDAAREQEKAAAALLRAAEEQERAATAAFGASLNLRMDVLQALRQFQTGLSTSEFLSPLDRLSGARSGFQELAMKARLGDTDAAMRLGDSANTYLAAGRSVFASGSGFQDIFREVTSAVGSVTEVNQRNLNVLLAETPAAIQAGFADQIRALQEGFTSVVDAVDRLSSGVRQAVSVAA